MAAGTQQIAELRKELLGTITSGHEALAVQIRRTDERITSRLDKMNGSIAKAHERVAVNAANISAVQEEVRTARARWHERMNAMADTIGRIAHVALGDHGKDRDATPNDLRVVDRGDLRLMLAIVLGSIGGTAAVIFWVLRLVGKL